MVGSGSSYENAAVLASALASSMGSLYNNKLNRILANGKKHWATIALMKSRGYGFFMCSQHQEFPRAQALQVLGSLPTRDLEWPTQQLQDFAGHILTWNEVPWNCL
jgi:hypothetical protein